MPSSVVIITAVVVSLGVVASLGVIAVVASLSVGVVASSPPNYKAFTSCSQPGTVMLGFDDGPNLHHDYTMKLVDMLTRKGVRATFFVTPGAMGEDPVQLGGRCALIRKLVNANMEIGIHNWLHEQNAALSVAELKNIITRTKGWLVDCGARNVIMYRPPYGQLLDEQAIGITNELEMVIAMWNVEPGDSETILGPAELRKRFNDDAKYLGDRSSYSILLHDGIASMNRQEADANKEVAGVAGLIDMLKSRNYEFLTATSCYHRSGQKVARDHGGPHSGPFVFLPRVPWMHKLPDRSSLKPIIRQQK